MTLAGNTVYPYGSIDTNFDPPQFSFDSAFKGWDPNPERREKYGRIRIYNNAGGYTNSHALYLSGGGELGRALTPRLLSSELLGGGLAAEAVSAAAVRQARPAPHPTLQSIRLQPEPAGSPSVGYSWHFRADPDPRIRTPD